MWFMGMPAMISQKIPATKPLIFDQRGAHVKAFPPMSPMDVGGAWISPFLGVQL